MKEDKIPFETMLFDGVEFKVINRHQAHEIIGNLTDFEGEKIYNVFEDTWRFPDYEEKSIFLLAENDVEMDMLEMKYDTNEERDVFILGFIFKGNLTANISISAWDTDNSPALIVLGKTTTINITLFGSVHYLGGGLKCDSLLGEYNHGELFVKGDTTAWLVYSDDMRMHFETFTAVQAVINVNRPDVSICSKLTDVDGSIIIVENYFPSTHKLSDIVNDLYIEHSVDYDSELLTNNYYEDVFKRRLSLIDHNKSERYLYTNFRNQFINMIEILSDKEEIKRNGSLCLEYESTKYVFVHFIHNEMQYSQISAEIVNGFNIRMRALLCNDTQEITLLLEYLNEDGTTKYQWLDNEVALGIEYYSIKCAVINAFEVLTNQSPTEDYDENMQDKNKYALNDFSVQFGESKIPNDLIKLFEFEYQLGNQFYSESFYMHSIDKTGLKTWSENEEFYNQFIEFAKANGTGSSYAYWLIDDDLNNCPIVVFGDEGGVHIVAENTSKLIQLLTYDVEISVDHENIYYYKYEEDYQESENREEYLDWVKENFGYDPILTKEETESIINEAKEKYQIKLNEFLWKFNIETY
jgi:hypothetical protein